MGDLQGIIDNISEKLEPISVLLKTIITKLKNRKKLINIADSSTGGWAVVKEYKKEPTGSDSDNCKRIQQAETGIMKKKKNRQERFQ